jgi:hypothetical protein
MGKKSRSGSSRIRDEHPGSCFPRAKKLFLVLQVHEFFDVDPVPVSGIFLTLDPG